MAIIIPSKPGGIKSPISQSIHQAILNGSHGDCSLATAPAAPGAPAPACARLGWAAARSRWRATAVVRGVARPRSWRRDAPGSAAPGRWPWRSPFRPQETIRKMVEQWWKMVKNEGKMVKNDGQMVNNCDRWWKNGEKWWKNCETWWFKQHNNRNYYFLRVIPTMKHYSDIVSDIESGSMYVYIYIYIYICVCVTMYIYIYIHLWSFMCVCGIFILIYFNILSDSLSGIIPTYFPAYIPTFFLTFYLASILTFFLAFSLLSAPSEISLRLRSGSAHWHLAPTVEVWQCPLWSRAPN